MYIVTIYDHNSTKENPIEPKTIVVSKEKLSQFFDDTLDDQHSILVAPIKNY